MSNEQWSLATSEMAQMLGSMYGTMTEHYEREAVKRGITIDQLAASAITEMIRERLEAYQSFSGGEANADGSTVWDDA